MFFISIVSIILISITLPSLAAQKIAEGLTLTFFCALDSRTALTRASHNEIPVYQKAEELTGIKVKYIHPPIGQEQEQFNLMLASGNLADIIYWNWKDVPGGPQKAIDDKVIIPLNDLIKKYAPNIAKFFKARPEIGKMIVTDKGDIYCVPFLRGGLRPGDEWQRYSTSPMLRKDWLDELGLNLPTTIKDWEKVLRAFKNYKSKAYPLVAQGVSGLRWFTCAWGINYDFYHVNYKVRYGAIEPQYREFLATMNRWYKEGLIDPDFMSTDYNRLRALVLEDKAGAFWGLLNRDMGGFTPAARNAGNKKFTLMSAPWPYAPTGKSYNFTNDVFAFPGSGAAISSTNKHPIESIKWMDFWWSEEGHILANFGIEGLTFNWTPDGFPKYTDLIMNNPEGLPVVNALSKYAPDGGGGRFWVQDDRYWRQMMFLPEQYESAMRLAKTACIDRTLPPVTATPEEAKELASILASIETYRDEMFAKFIMGKEPLSNFSKYVEQMKRMGIDRAIQLRQAALNRYRQRKPPKF